MGKVKENEYIYILSETLETGFPLFTFYIFNFYFLPLNSVHS